MVMHRKLSLGAQKPVKESDEYTGFRSLLESAGVEAKLVDSAFQDFRGPSDSCTTRNLGKACAFFGHLFAEPRIREPSGDVFTAVYPLVAESVRYGRDLSSGLWTFGEAVRDSEDPLGLCRNLSGIVDSGDLLLQISDVWSGDDVPPERARRCLEGLCSRRGQALLGHFVHEPMVRETFLRFSAKYPQDLEAKLNYDATVADNHNMPPADKAKRLMSHGDMISLSVHYGVGIVGVGPSSETHEGIERRIGLEGEYDGVRKRIVPATMVQMSDDAPYELILPQVSREILGGEMPPLGAGVDPMRLVAWHMFDQGFSDCIVRVQGDARFEDKDVLLSEASRVKLKFMPGREERIVAVRSPDDLPKMGYLRVRDKKLAALVLLSADSERKHIADDDEFCVFKWDKGDRELTLEWMRFKHVKDANPNAVLGHIRSLGRDWSRIKIGVKGGDS
ncbi:MAG: hypothetical protein ABH834_06760 [Candidatus Altiarchaeota archaeon]